MIEKSASKAEGLSKTDLLNEFWNFRSFFLLRIRHIVQDMDVAEDIFQEACQKFLLSPAIFEFPKAATNYFCLILQTSALIHIKRRRWLEYQSVLPEMVCETENDWGRNILLDRIAGVLSKLPTRERLLLETFLDSDLHLKEKCKALHLPRSTMQHQAKKAIQHVTKMVIGKPKNFSGNHQCQIQ